MCGFQHSIQMQCILIKMRKQFFCIFYGGGEDIGLFLFK